ncbi:amino acid/amide ABC transporter membrane protein 2, HAAT family [Rhizobiales bacterium GAS188]|nr:amino acid/amide ABC transporter membrane protein 2, HAAT family [Rhizobiales bacterium GAS188]
MTSLSLPQRLISGDRPGNAVLSALLVLVLLGLAFTPFLFPGARPLETASRICIFIVLVASYDLLIGYTGIVSFAHTMFFALGAYGVALALTGLGPGFAAIGLGMLAGALAAALIGVLLSLFLLRVRAIFFSMVTLAVAAAFAVLVSQLSFLTGGEDGLSYAVPRSLTPAFRLVDGTVLGARIDGRLIAYYAVFAISLVLFLMMLRIVNSPFGRVLKAIRENGFRAEAIGYEVGRYRMLANILAAVFAALSGGLLAVWLKYTGPATTLSLEIMTDVLLMVVVGGMGTMYGAVIGVTVFTLMQNYLQDLMKMVSTTQLPVPLLSDLLSPDRWLFWLGVLFVASVYFFPSGIVGSLRAWSRSE